VIVVGTVAPLSRGGEDLALEPDRHGTSSAERPTNPIVRKTGAASPVQALNPAAMGPDQTPIASRWSDLPGASLPLSRTPMSVTCGRRRPVGGGEGPLVREELDERASPSTSASPSGSGVSLPPFCSPAMGSASTPRAPQVAG
jgi:hypothetical protein